MSDERTLAEPTLAEPTLAEQIEAVDFAASWHWRRLTDEAQPKLRRRLMAAVRTLRQVDRANAVLEELSEP